MNLPSSKLHPLKGELSGHWSVWVNGNWRVTFLVVGTDAELVDYQDESRRTGPALARPGCPA